MDDFKDQLEAIRPRVQAARLEGELSKGLPEDLIGFIDRVIDAALSKAVKDKAVSQENADKIIKIAKRSYREKRKM